jgi:hypothetical protein
VRQLPERHSRFIFHITPTFTWLNTVAGFFANSTGTDWGYSDPFVDL